LAELLEIIVDDREPVFIIRRGFETFALIAANEPNALLETVHRLRSRTNVERILTSLARARARVGHRPSWRHSWQAWFLTTRKGHPPSRDCLIDGHFCLG
jgi:PHD/YefM family antitoxin component YafN of YafNO toxin-antitoxin module